MSSIDTDANAKRTAAKGRQTVSLAFLAGATLSALVILPYVAFDRAFKSPRAREPQLFVPVSASSDKAPVSAKTASSSSKATAAVSPSCGSTGTEFLYEPAGHTHDAFKNLDPSKLAPLTAWAQEYLWKHQHPEDCDKAEFVVSRGHVKGNGIGSILHVSGYHFAAAIERGKVFMWHQDAGEEWTDDVTCGSKRNWECHFKTPTHCKRDKHLKRNLLTGAPQNYQEVELHHTIMGLPSSSPPTVFVGKLKKEFPSMTDAAMKYWWRAQSVTYLMRLNNQALDAIKEMRLKPAMLKVFPDNKTLTEQAAATIPWPAGIIHAHVRHGDKYTEMQLQETKKYMDASKHLYATHPLALKRILFISTEDKTVIEEAQSLLEPGWSLVYSDIRRANVGPLAQVVALGKDSAGTTTRTHLTQLLMSLEADSWIGTRGSNWNRLIDELRCTWVAKCSHPYVEVGTDKSWKDYDW